MKTIGLDLRCLPIDGSEGSGVAHAVRELCSALTKREDFFWIAYVPKGAIWSSGEMIELKDDGGYDLRKALKYKPCDLLFVPHGAVAPFIDIQCVPWVHDLIIFEHPEWFPQSWFKRVLTTRLFLNGIQRAPLVFAVSEYTKTKILKIAKLDNNKIIVTGEGGDSELASLNNEQLTIKKNEAKDFCKTFFGLNGSFVLCLSTVEPRKNIGMLIRAWKKARSEHNLPLDLVIAGRDGWNCKDVMKEINNLNPVDSQMFHRLSNVTDFQRRQLLLAAQLVVLPSLDEGFGLTALEAMQAGSPIAVSNAGALVEVVGEAGMVLDPKDESAWASVMMMCAHDERTCQVRARMGINQIIKYTWEKAADKVIEGFKFL